MALLKVVDQSVHVIEIDTAALIVATLYASVTLSDRNIYETERDTHQFLLTLEVAQCVHDSGSTIALDG